MCDFSIRHKAWEELEKEQIMGGATLDKHHLRKKVRANLKSEGNWTLKHKYCLLLLWPIMQI